MVARTRKQPARKAAPNARAKPRLKRNPVGMSAEDEVYEELADELDGHDVDDLGEARDRFRHFTGKEKTSVSSLQIPKHGAIYALGRLCAVIYEAEIDGEINQYIHRFSRGTRPHLASSPDGEQLYIVGGRYEVTNRGVENRPKIPERNAPRKR